MDTPEIVTTALLGHWTAYFSNCPQIAFGGATPEEAIERLKMQYAYMHRAKMFAANTGSFPS